ncbi:MAG TPA: hypothetical protein VN754_15160, partial [Candidatus Binataceae bacterium]|nr:hypothetical protein [Candidatus Binataceae bacterium]
MTVVARRIFTCDELSELPAYSLGDAASYVRVPYQTLRYWALGRDSVAPLIKLPACDPPALSFANLLECHVLNALRTKYELRINAVRRGLETLQRLCPGSNHPLLETALSTDKVDLFLEEGMINLSRGGQRAIKEILHIYMQRIEWKLQGPKFYPFVAKDRP